jgi:hypothetical protein
MSSVNSFIYDEYVDEDLNYNYDVTDSDNRLEGKDFKCNNRSLVMQSGIKIRDGDAISSNITLFVRKHRDRYIIECIPHQSLIEYMQRLDSCMFRWSPRLPEKTDNPVLKLPSTGIWIDAPYELLTRYSAFLIYDYEPAEIGSTYEHFSSKISHDVQNVGRIAPISKTRFLSTGKAEFLPEITLSDTLDWAPEEYPGYSVRLEYNHDCDPILEHSCWTEYPIGQIGLYYRYYSNGGFGVYRDEDFVVGIEPHYNTLYNGFRRYILIPEDIPDGITLRLEGSVLQIEYRHRGEFVFRQIFSNIYNGDVNNYATREPQPDYEDFLDLGISERVLAEHDFTGQLNGKFREDDVIVWYRDGKIHRDDDLPAMVSEDGSQAWYIDGELHREDDKPAIIRENGDTEWYWNGRLNREDDKPAVEKTNGEKAWYIDGFRHRDGDNPAVIWYENGLENRAWYRGGVLHRDDDKPSVEKGDGTKLWYRDGKRHREDDKPAVEKSDGERQWWMDDVEHRDDGPAVIHGDGTMEWWRNGNRIR